MKGLLIQNFYSTLYQKGIKAHAWCYCCSSFLSLPLSSYILFICFSKSYEHMGFHPIHQVFLFSSHPTAGTCEMSLVEDSLLCPLGWADVTSLILPSVSSTPRISGSFQKPLFSVGKCHLGLGLLSANSLHDYLTFPGRRATQRMYIPQKVFLVDVCPLEFWALNILTEYLYTSYYLIFQLRLVQGK